MKNLILILFLVGAACSMQGQEKEKQSLKDLLYGGKLKKDSTGVIHNTDDLSKKIDTSTKKEVQPVTTNQPVTNAQQDKNAVLPKTDNNTKGIITGADTLTANVDNTTAPATSSAVPPKSNNRLLKEFTDSLVRTLQAEVLKAKQVKKNTYYLMMDYEIGTDGQVTFTNITSTPENSFLQSQVSQILDSTPLRLAPVTDSNNQPKKVKRKQQFTVTKE